jgi:hypothetical protein
MDHPSSDLDDVGASDLHLREQFQKRLLADPFFSDTRSAIPPDAVDPHPTDQCRSIVRKDRVGTKVEGIRVHDAAVFRGR